ncbi:hypothetical protein ACH5RR_012819 [Cinchona calisaya]|uniref:Uncharacterized protein n=1 Tax=Cinchona calisaya TaxID=153742 RepID=A0ABD3A9D5_9GENT
MPPLLPSEKDNNGIHNPKRHESRVVSSSFKKFEFYVEFIGFIAQKVSIVNQIWLGTTARPLTPNLDANKGNAGGGEPSVATKLLVTATRSLSVSFQGEAFSLPISKTNAAPVFA